MNESLGLRVLTEMPVLLLALVSFLLSGVWPKIGLAATAILVLVLVGKRRFLIGSSALLAVVGALFLIPLAQKTCLKPQPRPFLQLTLDLARRQWHVGEKPWYLLRIKNLGYREVFIMDGFWINQAFICDNFQDKKRTYFEITGPDGKLLKPNCWLEWGQHGEFNLWANDCGGELCNSMGGQRGPTGMTVKPGETYTATPSVVAPLKDEEGWGLRDARIRPDSTSAEIASAKELWKLQEQYQKEFGGVKRYQFDPMKPPQTVAGFRILDGFFIRKPGIHRMKAVYDSLRGLGPLSADEEIEQLRQTLGHEPFDKMKQEVRKEWGAMKAEDLEKRRKWRAEAERCDRDGFEDDRFSDSPCVRVESNTVEIEVVP
ncbi:MAG: hypothetical protein HY748_06285 [Elusimicrobia bacterium]|nr:hypothetical protein [Elusimicrobiota bacterium]